MASDEWKRRQTVDGTNAGASGVKGSGMWQMACGKRRHQEAQVASGPSSVAELLRRVDKARVQLISTSVSQYVSH